MLDWTVLNKNDEEKMVEILMVPSNPMTYPAHLLKSIWKRNTDRIFNNRVYEARK